MAIKPSFDRKENLSLESIKPDDIYKYFYEKSRSTDGKDLRILLSNILGCMLGGISEDVVINYLKEYIGYTLDNDKIQKIFIDHYSNKKFKYSKGEVYQNGKIMQDYESKNIDFIKLINFIDDLRDIYDKYKIKVIKNSDLSDNVIIGYSDDNFYFQGVKIEARLY